eukprot:5772570-Pyramimonas_sp.AAC.1
MERALGRVASAKPSKIKLNTSQLDDWKTEVAKRIRTMCCHVQMAWTRASGPPKWLVKLRVFQGEYTEGG